MDFVSFVSVLERCARRKGSNNDDKVFVMLNYEKNGISLIIFLIKEWLLATMP